MLARRKGAASDVLEDWRHPTSRVSRAFCEFGATLFDFAVAKVGQQVILLDFAANKDEGITLLTWRRPAKASAMYLNPGSPSEA